jgi:putative transcriptional regulator
VVLGANNLIAFKADIGLGEQRADNNQRRGVHEVFWMIRIRIKELAARKGVLLKDVAEAIGITQAALSSIMTGRSGTTTSRLERLCRYFECELLELIEYVPEDEEEQSQRTSKTYNKNRAVRNELSSMLRKLERLPKNKQRTVTKSINQILEAVVNE